MLRSQAWGFAPHATTVYILSTVRVLAGRGSRPGWARLASWRSELTPAHHDRFRAFVPKPSLRIAHHGSVAFNPKFVASLVAK